MLLRQTGEGVVAISQPAHAWLAGVMARAWGNAAFPRPAPFHEVCLAASLHDLGWLSWEADPEFDPATGWPRVFAAVAPEVHTQFWRNGIAQVGAYGAYAAVLVSMHGNTIYERTFNAKTANAKTARPAAAEAVRAFLADQKIFQEQTIATIRQDPVLAVDASDAQFRFNKRFIAAVDTMSLHVCWGLDKIVTIKDVPVSMTQDASLTLEADGEGGITVDPWPFEVDRLELRVQGRALACPSSDAEALSAALRKALPHTIVTPLHPRSAQDR